MERVAEALKRELPQDLYALVDPLFATEPTAVDELRRQVAAYGVALVEADKSRNWPDMDIDLGLACETACVALLDRVGEAPEPDAHMLVHIAVRYFVTSDDDEDDLESLVGFDDDAVIINSCARVLGADDAQIPLVPR